MTMTPATAAPIADVDLADFERDPYPYFRRWRQESPVVYLPALDGWIVTTWDDCEAVGRDEERFDTADEFTQNVLGHNVMTMSGKPHHALRAAVDVPLRPKNVARGLEQIARPAARALIEELRPRGRADATQDILEVVSVRVVGDFLGLADIDTETRLRWFHRIMDATANYGGDEVVQAAVDHTFDEMNEYFGAAVERVLQKPDDSALSALVHEHTPDGEPRTLAEIIGTLRVLVAGGFQEPGHGAASSLLGLLQNPSQAEEVRANPSLIPAAVHEGLRWMAPFGMTRRHAVGPVVVHGVGIPADSTVFVALGSANRDDARFPDGETFDIHRDRQPVASFGFGVHYCAGHFVARELEKIVLEEMFASLPSLRLDPERSPVLQGAETRSVASLPVVWGD